MDLLILHDTSFGRAAFYWQLAHTISSTLNACWNVEATPAAHALQAGLDCARYMHNSTGCGAVLVLVTAAAAAAAAISLSGASRAI